MGQMTNGILYGCEAPDIPRADPDDDDSAAYQLVRRWEKVKGIGWASRGLRVRLESEGGKELLGVWAVGGSGEDGAPYFLEACLPLDMVSTVYAKDIAKAKKIWDRFATYCAKKEGIALPPAALWLTPCEVA